jgi:hypothetical protein
MDAIITFSHTDGKEAGSAVSRADSALIGSGAVLHTLKYFAWFGSGDARLWLLQNLRNTRHKAASAKRLPASPPTRSRKSVGIKRPHN